MAMDYCERYRRDGFAVIRGVLTPAEVGELAEAFDRLYAEGLEHRSSYRDRNTFFALSTDPNLGKIVRMVQWPSYSDSVLARYRGDRRVADILAPLIGTDVKQIINQLHWKPPGASRVEFGYHQDARFRRPRRAYRDLAASYVQTGIAVDRHCAESGAMVVFPGSHLRGDLPIDIKGRVMETAADTRALEAVGVDPDTGVSLDLEPGDLALWNVHLIHGSGPNRTRSDRRLYINGYVAAAACDRGEWVFRGGESIPLGDPVLVHYEDLHTRPGPFYLDGP